MNTPAPLISWMKAAALALLLVVFGLFSGGFHQEAQAQGPGANFDHLKTGFALSGNHSVVRCESCHLNGVFKGTPRDCKTCHTTGSRFSRANMVTPANHIPFPSTQGCETCHGTQTFAGVKFSHSSTNTTNCASCHDGMRVDGKSANHIPTTAACSTCHKSVTAWATGAKPDHSVFSSATDCTTCHNGAGSASFKPSTHMPVGVTNCISCHNVNGWRPTSWNHTQVNSTSCSTCHSGAFPPADGKPGNHIPYSSLAGVTNCDTCHKGGYTAWNNGKLHTSVTVTNKCESCHLTAAYGTTAKPATAVHTGVTGGCEACHNTSTWAGAKVDHSKFTASTQCGQACHVSGGPATPKSATHIPLTGMSDQTLCASCHTVTSWTPTTWNHTQIKVAAACSTCHTGSFPPADGKSTNHIPYNGLAGVTNCDSCHKGSYTAWNNGKLHSSVTVTNKCESCHLTTAYGATGKPSTATHTGVTGNCESCHKSTSTWAGSKVDHSTFTAATKCGSACHTAGGSATARSSTHIPLTGMADQTTCGTCHTYPNWTPTKWNHTQFSVAAKCSTCHSGAYPPADGKPANHIPYATVTAAASANCDTCHKAGYSAWNPGLFHSNVSTTTQCATCHLSTAYGVTGKPNTATHASVTGNCENCHKTTATWSGTKMDHSTFTIATKCGQACHIAGGTATPKSASHIPLTGMADQTTCGSCHTYPNWTPTKWNHTQMTVAGKCSTCHSGGYPPADGKPANHIPYSTVTAAATANCDTCHKAGYASWNPGRFHANVTTSTQCSSCHLNTAYGLTGKPNTSTHASVTGNCESCHRSTASWTSVTYTHAAANAVGTGTCDNCHNGSTSAVSKPSNHIPVQVASAKCDSCHKSQVSFTASTTTNHALITASQACKTCHIPTYASWGALAKPTNHIPETILTGGSAMDCKACHTNYNAGGFTTLAMNHNASPGGAGQCATCHNSGTSYLGNQQKKSLTHQSKTGVTDCSQSGCHRPLGNKGTAYKSWT